MSGLQFWKSCCKVCTEECESAEFDEDLYSSLQANLIAVVRSHIISNLSQAGGVVEFSIANFLVLVAFVLLVTVTGGVAYLTSVEWRDRRRLDKAKRKK
ncbi:hypothetical protein QUA97_04285 [Microcoleus sp. CZ3-B2]